MEKTMESFDQELINQQNEDYVAYQEWLGQNGNASKENLDEYYKWLNNGGYEEIFNEMLNEEV